MSLASMRLGGPPRALAMAATINDRDQLQQFLIIVDARLKLGEQAERLEGIVA